MQKTLRHWQTDKDLSGVRDAESLAKLPAEEQEAWKKLWSEVEALMKKASGKGSVAALPFGNILFSGPAR